VAGLKDQFIDFLEICQMIRAKGVSHSLLNPFLDAGRFPIGGAMLAKFLTRIGTDLPLEVSTAVSVCLKPVLAFR
jgi:predicted alpha/beta-fold hydrolase